MKGRTVRDKREQLALSMKICEQIYHEISTSQPPALEDIANRFDVDRHTVHRMIALFDEEFSEDHPHVAGTVTGWLSSLRASPEEQQNVALLIKDMLSSPETWGVRSIEDLSTAIGIPVRNCKSYYKKFWEPDWPAMPKRDKGWISQDAAQAAELGDIEALQHLIMEEGFMAAMRQELVHHRVKEFSKQPTTHGGES